VSMAPKKSLRQATDCPGLLHRQPVPELSTV